MTFNFSPILNNKIEWMQLYTYQPANKIIDTTRYGRIRWDEWLKNEKKWLEARDRIVQIKRQWSKKALFVNRVAWDD